MIINPFCAQLPNPEMAYQIEDFLDIVAEQYLELKNEGCFDQIRKPGFYIYRIEDSISITGLVVALDLREVELGNILGHEQTLLAKESEMKKLISKRRAMIKPVLLGITLPYELSAFMKDFCESNDCIYEAQANQALYKFWLVNDNRELAWIQGIFDSQVSKAYVADGHHRVGLSHFMWKHGHGADGLLAMLTDFDSLGVYAYHRILQLIPNLTLDLFFEKLSEVASVQKLDSCALPEIKYSFTIYAERKSWLCTWLPSIVAKHSLDLVTLDVQLINIYILERILGIEDVKASPLLSYVSGMVALEEITSKIDLLDNQVGVLLYPIDISDIKIVADNKQNLPPKSSWFEPRIKNGLITLPLSK
jgi:uncharacterized protein (DUF1015 family)